MASDETSYEYYLLGGVTPVRVALNGDGLPVGAEIPDAHSQDGFERRLEYLDRLNMSDEVREITAEEFDRHAATYRQHRKNFGLGMKR